MIFARNSLFVLVSLGLLPQSFAAPVANSFLASSDLLANGQDAQQQNAQFATLSANDSCTDGEQGCVGTKFAQCVGGTWSTTDCSGGTQCFALPLVNSRGTSVTCDTEADALSRIENTGATGGITGDGSTSNSASPVASDSAAGLSTSIAIPVSSAAAGGGSSVLSTTTSAPVASSSAVDDSGDDEGDEGEDGGCSADGSESTISSATSVVEASASETASATESISSGSATLRKRQDAIGDIQSTLIPISAIGTAVSSASIDASASLSTSVVPSDPFASLSATDTGAVPLATDNSASGTLAATSASDGGATVTITVTITTGASLPTDSVLASQSATGNPLVTSSVADPAAGSTSLSASVAAATGSAGLLTSSVSDPLLPTTSAEITVSPSSSVDASAGPTTSSVFDPLLPSSTADVEASSLSSAVPSAAATGVVNEVGASIASSSLSTSAELISTAATPTITSSVSQLFASGDIASMLTATI